MSGYLFCFFDKYPHKSTLFYKIQLTNAAYGSIIKLSCIFEESTFMSAEIERWCSLKEIMEHLGVSRDTILIWIAKRDMPASKVGRLWKFKVSEVDAWVKAGNAAEK